MKKRKFYNPALHRMLKRHQEKKDKGIPIDLPINQEYLAANEARVRHELAICKMKNLLAVAGL